LRKIVSGTMLTLVLISILSLAFNNKLVATGPTTILAFDANSTTQRVKNTLNQIEPEAAYVRIARYYDNRKCAVTSSHDDLAYNTSAWQKCLSMLTKKKIYHTVAIITNSTQPNDWNFMQYWLNQGYTEAGSHSRSHVHAPYTGTDPYTHQPRVSYEWQINGSKNDIIGNLTLPNWWRYGNREYVYAWIEPYGSSDDTVRQWLGDCYYLSDRLALGSGVYDFAGWDSANELFNRVGFTVEVGSAPWGGYTSVSLLNSKFDYAYNNGKIYHLMTHPAYVNWSEGAYADQHTDYISNRKDVWYVPFGLLYLYHWVDVRNITSVTSFGSGQDKIFKISINEINHLNYGISYPITYVFDIPSSWTRAYVYYRYLDTDPWTLMNNKSSEEFFNGIDVSRFNFTDHKAYVSIGFSSVSHNIYLQLRHSKSIEVPGDYPTIQEAINAAYDGDTIFVRNRIYYENIIVNKRVSLIGEDCEKTIIDAGKAGTAVLISNADYVTFIDFTIRNSGIEYSAGISLNYANYCNIIRNIITNNSVGVMLYYSSNNKIAGNDITANSGDGVALSLSSNNMIFHNNFINNTNQVYLHQSFNNTWDDGYPHGGNYWSEHNDTDLYSGPYQNETGSDGIGDAPYVINENNQDNYPFMNPLIPHEIAATNITPSKTIVGKGFLLCLNLTMTNRGTCTEAVNVTIYANTTILATLTNITLTNRTATTITFTWNTTGFSEGYYVISAYVWPVPGEMDTMDNAFIEVIVTLTIPGDVDGDLNVDIFDVVSICVAYCSKRGQPQYKTNCDINSDGKIDIYDVVIACAHYGQKTP